jgi:hypothetical protein
MTFLAEHADGWPASAIAEPFYFPGSSARTAHKFLRERRSKCAAILLIRGTAKFTVLPYQRTAECDLRGVGASSASSL